MPELDFLATSVVDLAAAVRAREVSARELARHALDQIEARNPAVNAFVAVDADRALEHAASIDERVARGDDPGPMAGIPLAVKDVEDAIGFVTTSGSMTKVGDPVSARDSVHVARLRAAGCVIIGKTNVPEFGLRGETDNKAFGITRNPWNLDHTPGGSSGGSAAALASGMVPLATGSDGGGSIRIPSAVCGLSGLKPSLGRVPAADPEPPGWTHLSTRGPLARRIADVALALDVVVGPHPRDIRSLPAKTESWFAAIEGAVPPRRVAWSPTLGYATVDREIVSVCETLLGRLADAGTEVVEIDKVFSADPGMSLGVLVQTYMRRTVEPFRGTEWWAKIDPAVLVAAELARVMAGDSLAFVRADDAAHTINVELQAVLDDVDFLLCPVTRAVTAECDHFTEIDELLASLGGGLDEMLAVMGVSRATADEIVDGLRAAGPINVPVGRCNGEMVAEWHGMTQAFNMTRSPAGTTCAGFTADGLPVGIQVVGAQHDDAGVLGFLSVLEGLSGSLSATPPLR